MPEAVSQPTGQSLFVMVGEKSADRHAAPAMAMLKRLRPELKIWGAGGSAMEAAGVELLRNCEEFAVIGIVEVWARLLRFYKLRNQILEAIAQRKPDVILLIDMGAFNLQLSKDLRKRFPKLPILYFISPQVWASREWRINTLARTVTKMLVIFPFEEKVYLQRGVPAKFVGHPLLTTMPDSTKLKSRQEFCADVGLNPDHPIIGIFAGSRQGEVRTFGDTLMQAVQELHEQYPSMQFVFSAGDPRLEKILNGCMKKAKLEFLLGKELHILDSTHNWHLMNACDLLWAKSGTTTLEAALVGKPMICFYGGMWLSYFLFMGFKRIKRVAWPNVLAGELLVPELFQLDCRAEQLVRYTRDLLDVPALRQEMSQKLLRLQAQLGQGDYASNVANEVISILDGSGVSGSTSVSSPPGSAGVSPAPTAE